MLPDCTQSPGDTNVKILPYLRELLPLLSHNVRDVALDLIKEKPV